MTDPKRHDVAQWLHKSQHDLGSAAVLMSAKTPYLDTAVYHCQQAVEKVLKAWLTHSGIPFEKTHDLTALLDMCTPLRPDFERWRDAVEELTPYATFFRYPGDVLEPTMADARNALSLARDVVTDVTQVIGATGS
jgi:HEPN domain-containing protein